MKLLHKVLAPHFLNTLYTKESTLIRTNVNNLIITEEYNNGKHKH